MSYPRVLLAMPCLHGIARMGAMKTMAEVAVALFNSGCAVATAVIAPTDVVLARNYMAGTALAEGYTHLFLLEPEMMFPARYAIKMFKAEKDVVGLVHPHARLDLKKLVRTARAEPQLPEAIVSAKAQDYAMRVTAPTRFADRLGIVAGVGAGALMIRTSALKALADSGRAVAHPPLPNLVGPAMPHWGFFDPFEENGQNLVDAFAFCARWRTEGGDVWALAEPGVSRIDDFDYVGDMLAN